MNGTVPTIESLTTIINSLLPEPHASLLAGMVFGVRRTMPQYFYNNLVTTGTLHVIALSGQNIAIIMNLVARLSLRIVSRKVSGLITIIFIAVFILFVGTDPPVVRAGLMGGLSLIAVYFGRMNWSLLSLIVASVGMILVRPDWLSSLSFQLSFAATLGIILFANAPKYAKKGTKSASQSKSYNGQRGRYSSKLFETFMAPLRQDLRLTLAAQVFTVPIILLKFHRVSLVSPLSNLLVGWVVPMITIGGMGLSILGWIWQPLAAPLAWILWVPLHYFIAIVDFTAKLPFASLEF